MDVINPPKTQQRHNPTELGGLPMLSEMAKTHLLYIRYAKGFSYISVKTTMYMNK